MQIKKVQPRRRVSAQAGLTGRSTKTLRKITLFQVQPRKQPSPPPPLAAPWRPQPRRRGSDGANFPRLLLQTSFQQQSHTHCCASGQLMCIPSSSEKSAFASRAAAPLRRCTILCTTTNQATTWKRDGKLRAPPTFNAAIPYLIRSCSSAASKCI